MLACLTIYLSSCKTTEIILYGHLTGTVTDNTSNDPIRDANVELISGNQSTSTDSLGNYQIRNIDPDDHTANASADGYFSNERFVIIREAEVNRADFLLERSSMPGIIADSLEFGFETDSLTFNLSNTGNKQMNYSFVPSAPWISIDPVLGFLDVSDSVLVNVSIDRTGMGNSTLEEYILINTLNRNDKLDLFVNRVMDMESNFYRAVEIDDQIWMAENLNVGTRIDLNPPYPDEDLDELLFEMVYNGIIDKSCYQNYESNCSTYGALYQWHEAMQWYGGKNDPGPMGPTQGVCPDGWHIPTENDWETLHQNLGGDDSAAIKMTEGSIDCTNDDPSANSSGFSALFGGYLHMLDSWIDMDMATHFWSDNKGGSTSVGTYFIGCNLNDETSSLRSFTSSEGAAAGLPVRCIKDP
jgi:uncharacterized protein (TIGR02145 family)